MSSSIPDRNLLSRTDILGQGCTQTPEHIIRRVTQVFPIPYDPQNQIIDD